ncbi:MAG: hypothetical protein ACRC41_16080 [Sarcina sp.]
MKIKDILEVNQPDVYNVFVSVSERLNKDNYKKLMSARSYRRSNGALRQKGW